ncbi:MAG TPA: pentapeptide repeat-containing protein, partial [Anaerolineae bacterium]|nr:pentapeptide repeat-containing protein [Anaerolineae bacterium]
QKTNLTGADCSEADLSLADLGFANLTGANLTGANMQMTILFRTRFKDTTMPDGTIR